MNRIVLAYSGSPDGSLSIPWLQSTYQAEVVTVTVDLGQGRILEAVRDRALSLGAVRAHVVDRREEFARDFVLPSLAADALSEDGAPMTAALGRPLLAKTLVEIAESEKATAIAHTGARARGTVDVLLRARRPKLKIVAPRREWTWSESERLEAARRQGIALDLEPCAADTNVWGRTIHCPAELGEPSAGIFTLTRDPERCPDEPAHVELTFERGVPTAVNRVVLPLSDLLSSLTTLAGAHGVGRSAGGQRAGSSDRVLREAPAAVLLHAAHRELRRATATKDLDQFSSTVSVAYAGIIEGGQWFSPLRAALDAYVGVTQERATGAVRFRIHKGTYTILDRTVASAASRRRPAIIPVATV